ncbi:hypothetical protein Ciccas_008168 [Cichlidogyrus casuarinus]|uniref:Uncharacterized protein n=1 Tax=Cichlidogyrus casuarinus TaxID=1844966 RepID=A0ABD2Q1J2_9PLAT
MYCSIGTNGAIFTASLQDHITIEGEKATMYHHEVEVDVPFVLSCQQNVTDPSDSWFVDGFPVTQSALPFISAVQLSSGELLVVQIYPREMTILCRHKGLKQMAHKIVPVMVPLAETYFKAELTHKVKIQELSNESALNIDAKQIRAYVETLVWNICENRKNKRINADVKLVNQFKDLQQILINYSMMVAKDLQYGHENRTWDKYLGSIALRKCHYNQENDTIHSTIWFNFDKVTQKLRNNFETFQLAPPLFDLDKNEAVKNIQKTDWLILAGPVKKFGPRSVSGCHGYSSRMLINNLCCEYCQIENSENTKGHLPTRNSRGYP